MCLQRFFQKNKPLKYIIKNRMEKHKKFLLYTKGYLWVKDVLGF